MIKIPSNCEEIIQQKIQKMTQKHIDYVETLITIFTDNLQQLIDKIFDENNIDKEINVIFNFTDIEFELFKQHAKFKEINETLHKHKFVFVYEGAFKKFEIIEMKYIQLHGASTRPIYLIGTRDDGCSDDDDENCVFVSTDNDGARHHSSKN